MVCHICIKGLDFNGDILIVYLMDICFVDAIETKYK